MPRFYFDCIDGEDRHIDSHGVELDGKEEAADHAACLAGAMLNENMPTEGTRTVAVVVRAEDDTPVYSVRGTFHGQMTPGRTSGG